VSELPPDTDAALVAVPNALHAPISIDLLGRGIHVLCEKPMAITVEACGKMVEASREKGSVLMVGHHKRFVPSVRAAKKLLDAGRLGTIRSVTGSMGMPRTWRNRTAFNLDPSLAGGGVLMDNGVHLIDLVLWLIGEMDVLKCDTLCEHSTLEDEAKMEFLTDKRIAGVLRLSDRRVLPNVFRVEGEDGFLEFDTYDSPSLTIFSRRAPACRSNGSIAFKWPSTSPYKQQLEYFTGRVKGTELLSLNSGEEAMRTVAIITEAYKEVSRSAY
jgi:predicted dehydrogenase